jgi:hypothetical protein
MHLQSLSGFKAMSYALVAALASGCGGGGSEDGQPAGQVSEPSGNAPPTIQGQPAHSILVGRSYSFQPAASDPNGDALTFTAANVPSWASLNATTGRISGTPTTADVGNYANITVTVSDGQSSASLTPFTINVTATANGSATLSWTAPTSNTDDSALTNLAGYQVLYGQSSSELDQLIELSNPSLSTFVVDNLTSGTWYFAVIAVNATGVASVLSNVTSKTIS